MDQKQDIAEDVADLIHSLEWISAEMATEFTHDRRTFPNDVLSTMANDIRSDAALIADICKVEPRFNQVIFGVLGSPWSQVGASLWLSELANTIDRFNANPIVVDVVTINSLAVSPAHVRLLLASTRILANALGYEW